jgi:hypothetical protein
MGIAGIESNYQIIVCLCVESAIVGWPVVKHDEVDLVFVYNRAMQQKVPFKKH